ETREVSTAEAQALNLPAESANVRIPAWRYALINLPHPTLKSGLVAYYTPSPQLLAAEPEVAIRMTASAQGLLLVAGGELTPAAQAIWKQYAHNSRARKLIVLDAAADSATIENFARALDAPPAQV